MRGPDAVMPGELSTARGAMAILERNALMARRVWLVVISGFFEPAFYLLAIGFGLGSLVGEIELADGSKVPYSAFVAPALLAVSAMNGALYDSTVNILWKLKYQRFYHTMLATPVAVPHIVFGEIAWAQLRGLLYSSGFLLLMAATGTITSWWAMLALPAAILVGLAFGAVGMAVTTFMRGWQDLELVTLFQLAMFLVSATFFPLSAYPHPLQLVIQASPLYHANELIRACCRGEILPSTIGHLAYLLAMVLVGLTVAMRRIDRLLRE